MALTPQFSAGEDLSAAKLNASSIPVVSATSDIVSPFQGQLVYNTTTGLLHRYTGSSWIAYYAGTAWISKLATESVTSSTALQGDNDFAWSVITNSTYALEGYVPYIAGTTGDINCDFTVPAGSSFLWTNFGTVGPAGGASLTDINYVTQGGSVARAMNGNGATTMSFHPMGYLTTAGTAGTLQFRWAQNTSDATATQVLIGSWMKLTKIA